MSNCPICFHTAKINSQNGFDGEEVKCPRCGNFRIFATAIAALPSTLLTDERRKANASGWVREHQDVLITTDTISQLNVLPTPSYEERKRKLLAFFQQQSRTLGQLVRLDDNTIRVLMGFTWSTRQEVDFLLDTVEKDALVEKNTSSEYRLTAKAYDYLAQLIVNPISKTGFCAMWFDKSVDSLWSKAIEPAIRDAGYQPLKINEKEHVNRIDDEIFADIRRSRFVVADFTHGVSGVRGGVYFEAGFAQGLGLPVIWTCRKDMLSEDKLHFDIRQYNFLEWSEDNLDDFKNRLQKRIEAILGRGSWKSE